MRIFGGKKDYYDNAAGYGIDRSIVYNRKSEKYLYNQLNTKINAPQWIEQSEYSPRSYYFSGRWGWPSGFYNYERRIVGFCGKLYPAMYFTEPNTVYPKEGAVRRNLPVLKDGKEYVYDYERARELIADAFDESFVTRRYRGRHGNREKVVKDFMTGPIEHDEIFVEVKAPVILLVPYLGEGDITVITNPNLAELQFYKIGNAFQVFQNISMYLSNQLVEHKEPDEIEDKYRIAQHGFDEKSFRHPTRVSKL